MNYRRGLFRLWLVASVVWLVFVLFLLPLKWSGEYFRAGIEESGRACQAQDKECIESREVMARLYFEEAERFNPKTIYFDDSSFWGEMLLLGAVVPPLIVYVIMWIIVWIIAGFSQARTRSRVQDRLTHL